MVQKGTFGARITAGFQSPSHLTILLCWLLFTESNIFPCVFSHYISLSLNCSKFIFLCRKTILSILGVLTLHACTKFHTWPPTSSLPQPNPNNHPSPHTLNDTVSPHYIEEFKWLHLNSLEITLNALEFNLTLIGEYPFMVKEAVLRLNRMGPNNGDHLENTTLTRAIPLDHPFLSL